MMCGDSLLGTDKSRGSASGTWSLISSWKRRGKGEKMPARVENDSIADKMEKSRKGNGLDGKRRGPAIQGVEQQAPWETSLQLELSLIGNGGMGFRRGLGTRVVMCGDTEASGAARRPRGGSYRRSPGPGRERGQCSRPAGGRGKDGGSRSVVRWGGLWRRERAG